jgi:cytochrome c553
MIRMLAAIVFFCGATILIQSAAAQPDPDRLFKAGDANKDGKLSQDEFLRLVSRGGKLKDNPAFARRVFEKLDTNNKGFLTLEQFKRFTELGGKKKNKIEPVAGARFNDTPTAEQLAFFEKKIRPVLVDKCYKCHSTDAEKLKGELLLDSRAGIRKGGEGGPVIVPGNPDRSPLIKAILYQDESTRMPPKAKLPDEVIADFEAWVRMGAPDPRDGAKIAGREIDIEKGKQFWAFQLPKRTEPPVSRDPNRSAWIRSPIDAFVLDAMDKKGIVPVGAADQRTLIRRAYFDLTGLPPTGDEVEAFVADASPQAFEKVVDRLLASPRFGERWARHWLDLARYAETTGKTVNFNFPNAWRYRDYVIDAFNKDKPYDQFIKEQLAGDLMASADPKVKAERIIATGFLAIGPKALNERNGTQFELDLADEQIEVTTQAFLGITVACARCHDHKFDPIPQKDYYALAGIFRSTETCYGTVRFIQGNRPTPLIALPKDSVPTAVEKLSEAERTQIESQIKSIQDGMKDIKPDRPIQRVFALGQISLLQAKLADYESDGTPKLEAMGVRDKPARGEGFGGFGPPKGPPFAKGPFGGGFGGTRAIADSPVYTRGEVDKPGAVVPRGFLQVMAASTKIRANESGRLELANWIASKNNPLTARVEVNRVWQHLFGRGIVPAPDNFGAAGQPPSDPALLDYLAITFVDDGWSVKKLMRRIVLSHTYQLDSKSDPKNFQADPENALLWRMTPRRLDAEALRDSTLAVSGLLDAKPPIGSYVARHGEGPATGPRFGGPVANAINDPRNRQRSIYLPVVRDNLPEAMSLFDAADPSLVVAERPITTVPAQSLYLLNSPFMLRAADAAAEKILKQTTTDTERIRAAYLLFFGRPPVEKELKAAEEFLATYTERLRKDKEPRRLIERETWAAFAQAMLASAEFQYRK